MKKFLLCVTIILSTFQVSRSESILTFGSSSKLTDQEVKEVEKILTDGWKDFKKVVKTSSLPPKMVHTSLEKATINIIKGPFEATAEVSWNPPDKKFYIFVSYDDIMRYSPQSRGYIMAHEFCHYYFLLPDHYHKGESNHPFCVMSNFHIIGFSYKLCPPCQNMVDKTYDR